MVFGSVALLLALGLSLYRIHFPFNKWNIFFALAFCFIVPPLIVSKKVQEYLPRRLFAMSLAAACLALGPLVTAALKDFSAHISHFELAIIPSVVAFLMLWLPTRKADAEGKSGKWVSLFLVEFLALGFLASCAMLT